jgi:hypothetical protein
MQNVAYKKSPYIKGFFYRNIYFALYTRHTRNHYLVWIIKISSMIGISFFNIVKSSSPI